MAQICAEKNDLKKILCENLRNQRAKKRKYFPQIPQINAEKKSV